MNDSIKRALNASQSRWVEQVADDHQGPWHLLRAPTEHHDFMPLGDKPPDQMTADEPAAAGDEEARHQATPAGSAGPASRSACRASCTVNTPFWARYFISSQNPQTSISLACSLFIAFRRSEE